MKNLNWMNLKNKYRNYAFLFVIALMLSTLVFTIGYVNAYNKYYKPALAESWDLNQVVYFGGEAVNVKDLMNETYVKLKDFDIPQVIITFPPSSTTRTLALESTTSETYIYTTTTLPESTTTRLSTLPTTTVIEDTLTNMYPASIPLKWRECYKSEDCCIHSTGCCPCGFYGGKIDAIRCLLIPKFETALGCDTIGIYCREKKSSCNFKAGCIPKYVNGNYVGSYCDITAKW